jgi:hypothetical protein
MQVIFQKHPTEGCIPACVLSVLAHRCRPHKYTEESLIEAIVHGVGGTDFARLCNGAPALRLSVGTIPNTVGGLENFLRSMETPGTMVCLKTPRNHCVVIVSFRANDSDPSSGIVRYLNPDPRLTGTPQETPLAAFLQQTTGEWARLP